MSDVGIRLMYRAVIKGASLMKSCFLITEIRPCRDGS